MGAASFRSGPTSPRPASPGGSRTGRGWAAVVGSRCRHHRTWQQPPGLQAVATVGPGSLRVRGSSGGIDSGATLCCPAMGGPLSLHERARLTEGRVAIGGRGSYLRLAALVPPSRKRCWVGGVAALCFWPSICAISLRELNALGRDRPLAPPLLAGRAVVTKGQYKQFVYYAADELISGAPG